MSWSRWFESKNFLFSFFPLFPLCQSHCVSCYVSELLLFGIMPACFIKPSCLICRVWMGPASNQLTWLLTRIQEQRLHWVTSERSSWLDSTASPCPILTVTPSSFITFQHCSHPAPDFFQNSGGHGRDRLNDSSAIEQKCYNTLLGWCLHCVAQNAFPLSITPFSQQPVHDCGIM